MGREQDAVAYRARTFYYRDMGNDMPLGWAQFLPVACVDEGNTGDMAVYSLHFAITQYSILKEAWQ